MPAIPNDPNDPPDDPFVDPNTTDEWIPGTRGRNATPVRVLRLQPGSPGDPTTGTPQLLDNVEAVTVTDAIGTDPGVAQIRYLFGTNDPEAPPTWEDAVNTFILHPKTILPDDEISIQAQKPSGEWVPIFHGRALVFEPSVTGRGERFDITCPGIAIGLWDAPVPGAIYRSGDPLADQPSDIQTSEVAHFNKDGKPNRIPETANPRRIGDDFGTVHPTFIDPENRRYPLTNQRPTHWTVSDAAQYIIFTNNPAEEIVTNPGAFELALLLKARVPKTGSSYDPNDNATYDEKPIIAPDKPISGRDWPNALNEIVTGKGFALRWALEPVAGNPNAKPGTRLDIFRLEDQPAYNIQIQARGSNLDPTLSNIKSIGISRNLAEVVNRWEVLGEHEETEASFVLCAGFPSLAADAASTGAIEAFDRTKDTWKTTAHDKHRLFIFDESGEGHYIPGASTLLYDIFDLAPLFGGPVNDTPVFASRRRKPISQLISLDPTGRPFRASLHISTDYAIGARFGVSIGSTVNGGTFTLGVVSPNATGTQTTSAIAWNATAPTVQTALEALSNVAPGDLIVSRSGARTWNVAAAGTFADRSMPASSLTINAGSLTTSGAGTASAVAQLATGGKPTPALWDGTGNWQPVSPGVWQMLKDRIGVYLNVDNPNQWNIGEDKTANRPYPAGVVKVVESLARPNKENPLFALRLNIVIKGDRRLKGTSGIARNPIINRAIVRSVDAKERYKHRIIFKQSEHNNTATTITNRDDTESAEAEANAMLLASSNGVLSGPLEIPWLTRRYKPGDRIAAVSGRGFTLDTSNGGSQAVPHYPTIIRRTHYLSGQQRTILEVSDALTSRHTLRRRITRKRDPSNE